MFENILLEKEQEDLLIILAEAARNVPRARRQKFSAIELAGSTQATVDHPGLPDGQVEAYMGDIKTLARANLLALSHDSDGGYSFDVTPLGFKYYEYLRTRTGQPIQRIETTIREYLDADRFRHQYSRAYQKWTDAESMLWRSENEQQLTMLGHLCREAMQEFVTILVEQYQPPAVDEDKAHTAARLRAVLDRQAIQLGTTERPLLDAILSYWGTVSDLVQRQEHAGQKEGQPLTWEDGRQVVFQTAVVMFEIDRALSRLH